MSNTVTAIILTFNEEQHIERCINSLKNIADEIFVIDSFSTDNTVLFSEGLGAKVLQNPFVNQAVQFNWGLQNISIKSDWILRIDADEYIDNQTNLNLKKYLKDLSIDINGLIVRRKIIFMGKPLLHGGWYPKYNLRIFRSGYGVCENRWMDEHIILTEGKEQHVSLDFVDDNLNTLSWWTEKHNKYATREAMDFFLQNSENESHVIPKFFGNDAQRKRWLKSKYHNFPLFIRPFLNFTYRYFFRLGFLDGKQGFIWHVLQGFWYRFLVDAKIYELKKRFHNNEQAIVGHIKATYQIK